MSGSSQSDPTIPSNQSALECLYDPAQYQRQVPFDTLAQLRRDHAVVWIEEHPLQHWPAGRGYWLVLRHAEVMQVLRDTRLFSSAVGATQLRDVTSPADLNYVQKMMLNMDPPQHTRLRRLLQNSFTSRAVRKLETQIQQHASDIFDNAMAGQSAGQCNFATDIAADMPLLVLADLFGMPSEDRYLLFDWANRVIGFQDPDYAMSNHFDPAGGSEMARQACALRPTPDHNGRMPDPRSRAGMPDLYHYAHLLAEHKRAHPADDIMSLLLSQVDDNDGSVSIEEFENMFWLFAVAGNETVRNGLPGGMLALLQNPTALVQLRTQPELLPTAVDEMLRWWTPVMLFRRTATSDTRIGKATIRRGDKVVVSFLSANRDERVFDCPNKFDLTRSPNPHLTFGYGAHFCLGSQLARSQMQAVFAQLIARFETLELDGEPEFLRSNFQRGIKRLPIRWTASLQ